MEHSPTTSTTPATPVAQTGPVNNSNAASATRGTANRASGKSLIRNVILGLASLLMFVVIVMWAMSDTSTPTTVILPTTTITGAGVGNTATSRQTIAFKDGAIVTIEAHGKATVVFGGGTITCKYDGPWGGGTRNYDIQKVMEPQGKFATGWILTARGTKVDILLSEGKVLGSPSTGYTCPRTPIPR